MKRPWVSRRIAPVRERARRVNRAIYAESFAPLLDFGWSPLRTIPAATGSTSRRHAGAVRPGRRSGRDEQLFAAEPRARRGARAGVDAISSRRASAAPASATGSGARLQALGYASGRAPATRDAGGPERSPRNRGAVRAGRLGELQGAALERALREILSADPANPQANVRLGYVLLTGRCAEAVPRFTAAIAAHLPSADAHLGLAACEAAARYPAAAERTLADAQHLEPDNPVVSANLGLVFSDSGQPARRDPHLQRALTLDPDLHQARFGLAIAYARTDHRPDAAKEADELFRRLPPEAPQRPEVERLLKTLR